MLKHINYEKIKRAVEMYHASAEAYKTNEDPMIKSVFDYEMKSHRALRDSLDHIDYDEMIDYIQSKHQFGENPYLDANIDARIAKWNTWLNGRSIQKAINEKTKERYGRTFSIYSIFIELLYKELQS